MFRPVKKSLKLHSYIHLTPFTWSEQKKFSVIQILIDGKVSFCMKSAFYQGWKEIFFCNNYISFKHYLFIPMKEFGGKLHFCFIVACVIVPVCVCLNNSKSWNSEIMREMWSVPQTQTSPYKTSPMYCIFGPKCIMKNTLPAFEEMTNWAFCYTAEQS